MKLWLIIYSAGVIGGSAGPLPYDMQECIVRRDALRTAQAETLVRKTSSETGTSLSQAELDGVASMSFECEYRDNRPPLGAPSKARAP